ncbi:MAG: flagellar protein FliT [bacterium]
MAAAPPGDPERLEALTGDIGRAATAGSVDAVRALLDERQRALAHAAQAASTPEARDRLRSALESVRALDAETESVLGRRLTALRREIGLLEIGRRGLVGYAGAARTPGKRIDERR